jgi:hypothetical protein
MGYNLAHNINYLRLALDIVGVISLGYVDVLDFSPSFVRETCYVKCKVEKNFHTTQRISA